MADTESSLTPFQQAAAEARAEQSKDHAPASTETSTEAKPDTQPAQDTTAQGAPPEGATQEPQDLVTDDEFKAIQAQFPNDAAKQRTELNKLGTQKLQKIAELRKGLESYWEFVQDFEADPKTAVAALAKHVGVNLAEVPVEAKATEAAQTTAKTAADEEIEAFRQSLGPELDFLADKLAPALKGMMERTAERAVKQAVGPLAEQTQSLTQKAIEEQTDATLAAFTKAHPDWQKHEAAMVKFGEQLGGPGKLKPGEYMELLYNHVTKDVQIAEGVKAALSKMQRGAESAEHRDTSVAESRVTSAPINAKGRTSRDIFREAYGQAKAELATR